MNAAAPSARDAIRPVAIVGAQRIPFCRAGTGYADLTNLTMLTHVVDAIATRYDLAGETLGEVVAGAIVSHSRDWNLARESVLGTRLSPATPGLTLQQACGTSLQAAMVAAARIATGQVDCAIAAGSDTASDPPIVFGDRIARRFADSTRARGFGARLGAWRGFRPVELKPRPPAAHEPRTLLSMGEHCERMAKAWGIERAAQDRLAVASHHRAAAAWNTGFHDDLVMPCAGMMRDNNVRPDTSVEALGALRPVYDRSEAGTLTAGNSTPLTDGAAGVLLASEAWARERGLPVLAWLTHSRTAAIDFVGGAGLLMAPTHAVAELLVRTGLSLQDFDLYEIHEAFAAQVLCTLAAWEDEAYCRDKLGLDAPLGAIDPARMNVVGSSLAVGHPFAATGARLLGTLAQLLHTREAHRGLISVCTAGGMGLAAVLER